MKTPDAMSPVKKYDLTEITRLLLKMRDNCVRKAESEAYDDPERKEKYEALNAAIDLINNPSTLQRWISVKERLPEDVKDGDGYCVNYMVYIPEYRSVDIANYIEEADMWVCMGVPVNVTHWMPLPELPKEEI